MRRSIALLILFLLVGFTWARSPRPPGQREMAIQFVPMSVAKGVDPTRHLGPFRLEGAWRMASRSWYFGSYSALLAMPDGSLLALSDSGKYLRFMPPDRGEAEPASVIASGPVLPGYPADKSERDVEAAARDPRTDAIWLGLEGSNAIIRMTPAFKVVREVRARAIAGWGKNSGPEAMARLSDGRFVLLREASLGRFEDRRHDAVVFEGDPTAGAKSWHFVFDGPAGFSPTDMTQLPDGRLLILMRSLVWPMPQRFAGRLVIADPSDIRPGKVWKTREVARIASILPVDNFEGLAVTPAANGSLTVWLISDDNVSVVQQTVLWKLTVDPRQLP